MTIIELAGWMTLGGELLLVIFGLTVFRRWISWSRLLKYLGRFALMMAIFVGAIMVMSTLISILSAYKEYLAAIQMPTAYVLLVGGNTDWAMGGFILAVFAILMGSAWVAFKIGDCVIPRSDTERQLDKEETEWLNSKLPKWLQSKVTE